MPFNTIEKRREAKRAYYQKNIEKIKAIQKSQRYKINANHMALYHHTELQECSVEGCHKIGERHHPDYSRPLDIVWLCKSHHQTLHKGGKTCDICNRKHGSKGLCMTHYMAWKYKGYPNIEEFKKNYVVAERRKNYDKRVSEQNAKIQAVINKLERGK